MATSGELARALHDVLGIPLGTVNFYAQTLMRAGLVSTKGRGRSAAQMSTQDAVNLLIGLNGAATANDAVSAVHSYSAMTSIRRKSFEDVAMAKLPGLCKAISAVDGRDEESISRIARVVREAGLITTTKRGAGAAEMTSRDAANLLIGLNGASAANAAVDAIHSYSAMINHAPDLTGILAVYHPLVLATTFGSAVEAAINGVPELLLHFAAQELDAASNLSMVLDGRGTHDVRIEFSGLTASIHIGCHDLADGQISISFLSPRAMNGAGAPWLLPDRSVSTNIGLPTLLVIWKTLHGEEAFEQLFEEAFEQLCADVERRKAELVAA